VSLVSSASEWVIVADCCRRGNEFYGSVLDEDFFLSEGILVPSVVTA
jgi:hypothetical protein